MEVNLRLVNLAGGSLGFSCPIRILQYFESGGAWDVEDYTNKNIYAGISI